ncbi:MAG TPA: nitroreductase family deazaflavin-dependent oxidoreductase [Candidatus Limnocylindrales bacterium]|nr:nitroreductase family deazaflavin-dependent oxidoreductase [Candidatus Limnocylindrales bacterium]
MTTMNEFNAKIIDEFRANGGKVGGMFTGAPMLLLHSRGAKSGKSYTTPLVYLADGDRWVIIASKAGAATNPDWFHNLVANPETEIEVGSEKVKVRAEVVGEAERTRLYDKQASIMPQFAEYKQKTSRVIPVVALSRVI